MQESPLPTDPQALASALEQFEQRERLQLATDAILETALRDRLPLEETLTALFAPLAHHLKIESAFVRTYDEALELRDFHWSGPGARPFPIAIESFCAQQEPLGEQGDGWTALGQQLDVAGQSFGYAGVTLAGRLDASQAQRARDLLNTWSEVLDNRLAAVAQSRKKHQLTLELSDALKTPVLHRGIDRAIAVLQENIGFRDLVLLFRNSQDPDSTLAYKVIRDRNLVFDSPTQRSEEIDAFIAEDRGSALDDRFTELVEYFGITSFCEEVMISGVQEQQVVGRLVISSPNEAFNTFDRDLLERFADFLRQRIVDFNREWSHLSLCFAPPTVDRLLGEPRYQQRLEPTEEDVAILFCDISGFTRVSEQILKSPALIGKLINTWSQRVVEIVWESAGVFDKMVGDCAIALWGPPFFEMSAREACRQAANAALEIREYTKSLSHARELPELAGIDPPLGVATGLNYAPLFVGRFGPNKDYTGFSSGMNNTARLQGVAVRDEILCMQRFAAILEGEAAFGEIRQAQVKNVAAPLAFRALEQITRDGANAPAPHRR